MKKYLFGIFAIALAIGFSAFTSKPSSKADRSFATVYFQFIPANGSETGYETESSWDYLESGLPMSNPCTDDFVDVCVVHVDDSNLTTGDTNEEKFANYLASLSGGTGATDYVTDADNYDFLKP